MEKRIQNIVKKLEQSQKNLIFTGAGISTESGIPDFRGKGGVWERFQPVYYNDFMTSQKARIEYWRQKTEMYHHLKSAKPNPAHLATAHLFKKNVIEYVITQNIDGLHQEAGIPDENVIELHGSNKRVRCMSCNEISSVHDAHERITQGDLAPACHCGGFLKPDTISFGQQMPFAQMEQAIDLAAKSDLFIVIGSTLLVQPASNLPIIAKEKGAFLVIINLSVTPCDDIADIVIQEKAGDILPRISTAINK